MKNIFKALLPSAHQVKSHRKLQFLGKYLHDPNLWHLNRRSSAGGTAIGLFVAFVPLPIQMILAVVLAILFRVNLPLSITVAWINNPFTIPPMFYFAYKVGAILLGVSFQPIEFNLSFEWLFQTLGQFWQPLLLGCFILATLSALFGYLLVNILWCLQVNRLWRKRH